MLEKIINSKTRLEILALFFKEKDREFYAREIVSRLKLDAANVHNELVNLVASGFLTVKKNAGKKFFSLDRDNPFFNGFDLVFGEYKSKNEGEKWFYLEEMPDYHPRVVAGALHAKKANDYLASLGLKKEFSKFLATYQNNLCGLLVIKKEFEEVAAEMVEKVFSEPEWGERYVEETKKREKILVAATAEFEKVNLKSLSGRDLFRLYDDYYKKYLHLHILHWVQTVIDFGDNVFSKRLIAYLKPKIEEKKDKRYSLGEVFSVLTTPVEEGNATKEYKDLLLILQKICSDAKLKKYFRETETRIIVEELPKLNRDIDKDLDEHAKNFGWLGFGIKGPGWGKDYFIEILGSLIRQGADPGKLLAKTDEDRKNLAAKQKEFTEIFGIDPLNRRLFAVARGIVLTKGLRKDAMFNSFSVTDNFLREIGRRYYLSLEQVRYIYPEEYEDLLLKNKYSAERLSERFKFSLQLSTGKSYANKLLDGEAAKKFMDKIEIIRENTKDVKTLLGDCASPGRVKGEVVIVNQVKDMVKMKEGDVLVSIATNPDLVPALKKASAIVTDLGGITCHAAIISRELGIPCVVGTKIATKVLKDGFLVDVDATHGKVDIIKN